MADLIFHHYPASLFSEKVRVGFGLKNLDWRSVEISPIMPRPDLMPLTGGYRRTPVLQIGADIYCDTQIILRELERRFPEPSFFPDNSEGLCLAISMWTDRGFFQAAVGAVFGSLPAEALPAGFIDDREKLSGRRMDLDAMRAAAPAAKAQCRGYLDWVEMQLSDDREWLLGSAPSHADLSVYMDVWFLDNARAAPCSPPRLTAWKQRVRAIGHGNVTETGSEVAREIAAQAVPTTEEAGDPEDPAGLQPGDEVTVTPDDYGRIPVPGTLVSSSSQHVAIRRNDPEVGDIIVHFPRIGFAVTRR